MSSRGRGGRNAPRGLLRGGRIGTSRSPRGRKTDNPRSTSIALSRARDSSNYQLKGKDESRSLSEISSLSVTDISSVDLANVDIKLQSSLLKRLFREYMEVRKYKLCNISVEPLMNNFTEWHGNIIGPEGTPYQGGIFHFVINFKDEHPKTPPTVKMLTRIEHPCVNNGFIQLDMFTELDTKRKNFHPPSTSLTRSRYWYPGYSAVSILMQLEAFLYEGTIDIALRSLSDLTEYEDKKSRWESGVRFSVEQSIHMSCSVCKHRPRKPWPAVEPVDCYKRLYDDYLENAICFYTLKTYSQAALGIGINFTKDAKSGSVQIVKCVPQVVSLSAYKSSKIREVWGESYSHWMPIYLADVLPERSIYLAKRSISTIYTGNPNDFTPSMALDFFPRLLCSTTVNFLQSEDGSQAILYLRSYCYMHSLFLQFLTCYPDLIEKAKEKLSGFINDPNARHIDNIQNSGALIVYLTFTGVSWSELMNAFVMESFDRNVRFIIKQFPELDTDVPNANIDSTRIAKTFSAYNITGLRFVMMQLTFNKVFMCPERSSLETVIADYSKHSSLIPRELEDKIFQQIEPIKSVNNFNDYFHYIGYPSIGEKEMVLLLRQAVANSKNKRYHGGKGIEVLSPEEFEKQRLGSIRPLEELLAGNESFTDNDWKDLVGNRFGFTELPNEYQCVTNPWKHLYLQHNLQELVGKLNENPDFKLLYDTLILSKDTLNHFEFVTFNPHNIKSHYFFLSRIVELLPNLTHLTIKKGETGLGEKGFKELVKGIARSSGSLEVLDMKYLGIDEVHVSKLAESHLTSEGLKTLILEGNLLGTDGSVKLSQLMIQHNSLPNLSELNLRCCRITDKGMEALAESFLVKRNLRKLDLSKNDATHVGLSKIVRNLAYNPRIEEVVLSELGRVSGRSEEMCVSLEKLFQLTVSLKTLNFWKTNVSQFINEKNMKRLAENSTLKVWDLGCVTGGAVEVLGLVLSSEVSKLEKLDLGSTSLDVGKCRRIYNRTKKKPSSITKLNLQNNSRFLNVSGAKDFELMVDFISVTFANVTHLDISNCNLVSDAAKVIADVLSRNTSLFHLDMSMNNIGKHGARFLATGLSQNTKLKVLRLDKNNIRSAGAHFLSSALSQPTCVLEELHLFSNFIDVPGTSAICSALSTNKQLKFIDLGLNKVRKRGAVAIIEMLSKNTSLNTLGLKFNYIPDSWAVKIVKQIVDVPLCKVNDIRLAGNSLQYETLISIVGLIKGADKDIKFDLYSRALYLHPDRMEKTVYVSPIAANVTPEILKKLFYSKKCGAITSITIEKHRKRKASFAKANYAFIEFAHKDSVELAVDLMRHHEAHLGVGFQPSITRAGIGMTR